MNDHALKSSADLVNGYLASRVGGEPAALYRAANHLIEHGGKRLRPYLVLKSCALLGGSEEDALPAAGAVEMIHNFTLIHDDIMDNDEMRHGVKTVHKRFGVPLAILAGDILFSKAYNEVARSHLSTSSALKVIQKLAGACIDVCEGQQYDMEMAESRRIPDQSLYIQMISKKTAALFDASCAMGAISAGAPDSDVKDLSEFGRNLGIAFQITDDLIGAMGDPSLTKKPVGNDIREGKKSLPILLAIKRARGSDGSVIKQAFGNPDVPTGDLHDAVSIIRRLGIEEEVRSTACEYAVAAKKSLKRFAGQHRKDLESLLDFVVERDG